MSQNPVGNHIFDVAVIGAGPAGLATACALAHNGLTTALLAAPHRPAGNRPDTRTAALFNDSIQLLKHLGAWEHMHGHCARMEGIRLVDDTDGLLKAPEVLFSASEIGEDTFGYNVPQPVLTDGLRRAADAFGSTLTVIETDGVD
ncbi:MAG: FAD-dependent monooxygenase, partial [Pseudomonadota bacterium]